MAQPSSDRDPDQIAHERAMAEVSDVLLNLEHALGRARTARKRLGGSVAEHNASLALDDVIDSLGKARKRLQRDTYFSGDELRLI